VYEFIGTPEQLAQFQCVEWAERDIIVVNASSCVCHVCGEVALVDRFNAAKEDRFLSQVKSDKGLMVPFRQFLAIKLLEGVLLFLLLFLLLLLLLLLLLCLIGPFSHLDLQLRVNFRFVLFFTSRQSARVQAEPLC
jgi:hypothetical protein